jgi:hypothetical protein
MLTRSIPVDKRIPVDKIFCISLDRRPDRWSAFISAHKDKPDFLSQIEKISAIDGRLLNIPKKYRRYSGAYGCLYSHWRVAEKILSSRIQRVLVLEDGCRLRSSIVDLATYLSDTIAAQIDYIHLGRSDSLSRMYMKDDSHITFDQIGFALNTHAYVMTPIIAERICETLRITPFPINETLHTDRLLMELASKDKWSISCPKNALFIQDKSIPGDIEWGIPWTLRRLIRGTKRRLREAIA